MPQYKFIVSTLCPMLNCNAGTEMKDKPEPRRSLCSDLGTQHSREKGVKNRAPDPKELIIYYLGYT